MKIEHMLSRKRLGSSRHVGAAHRSTSKVNGVKKAVVVGSGMPVSNGFNVILKISSKTSVAVWFPDYLKRHFRNHFKAAESQRMTAPKGRLLHARFQVLPENVFQRDRLISNHRHFKGF